MDIEGIEFRVGDNRALKIDLRDFVETGDNPALVLPEETAPEIVDDDEIKILHTTFDPRVAYRGSAEATITGWNRLADDDVNLSQTSIFLASGEISSILATGRWPATSSMIYLGETAFLYHYLEAEGAENLEHQVPKLRRRLGSERKGIIKGVIDCLDEGLFPWAEIWELKDALLSKRAELQACRDLLDAGFPIRFNEGSKGPDLFVGAASVKLEVSKKHEQLDPNTWFQSVGRAKEGGLRMVRPKDVLGGLTLMTAPKIAEERDQGDIVFLDVSTLIEGTMMQAFQSFSDNPEAMDLKVQMAKAVKAAEEGEEVVVFYLRGRDRPAAAFVQQQQIIDYIDALGTEAHNLVAFRKKNPFGFYHAVGVDTSAEARRGEEE